MFGRRRAQYNQMWLFRTFCGFAHLLSSQVLQCILVSPVGLILRLRIICTLFREVGMHQAHVRLLPLVVLVCIFPLAVWIRVARNIIIYYPSTYISTVLSLSCFLHP